MVSNHSSECFMKYWDGLQQITNVAITDKLEVKTTLHSTALMVPQVLPAITSHAPSYKQARIRAEE